jgi:hypothetical protein
MKTARHVGSILMLILAAGTSAAQADTVALWTFESLSDTPGAGPHAADVGSGSALGNRPTSSLYSSPVGNGSANSFSSSGWAIGDYYQFTVSTIGFTDLALRWDQTSSNTGPRDFRLAYSTDGIAFTTAANYSVLANASPNQTWNATTAIAAYTFTQSLAAIDLLENQALVYFRLIDNSTTSANGGTVAAGGTNRVDNFAVSATAAAPVPLPAAVWLLGSALFGMAGVRRLGHKAA